MLSYFHKFTVDNTIIKIEKMLVLVLKIIFSKFLVDKFSKFYWKSLYRK